MQLETHISSNTNTKQNVIEFPRHKVVRDIPDKVIEERNRRADQKTADAIVDDITGYVLTELDNYNVEVESETFGKDFVLAVDAIKAVVYRSFGIEHHLHDFTDNNVKVITGNFASLSAEEIKEKIESMMAEKTLDAAPEE
jgi:hypothetical protein